MFYILLNGAAFMFLYVLLVWGIYYYNDKPSVIDTCWGIGILCLALLYSYLGRAPIERKFLVLVIVGTWAIRLSLAMLWRLLNEGTDKRYIELSKDWRNPSLGFLFNYYIQGVLMLIISTPIYYIVNAKHPNLMLDLLGTLICGAVIYWEARADRVLAEFRAKTPGSICKVGLWAKSRHPNYFFEFLLWFCLCLWGLGYTKHAAIGLVSPLTVYIIVRFITGPLTERMSIERYGDRYQAYQKEAFMIFPKFWARSDKG